MKEKETTPTIDYSADEAIVDEINGTITKLNSVLSRAADKGICVDLDILDNVKVFSKANQIIVSATITKLLSRR